VSAGEAMWTIGGQEVAQFVAESRVGSGDSTGREYNGGAGL